MLAARKTADRHSRTSSSVRREVAWQCPRGNRVGRRTRLHFLALLCLLAFVARGVCQDAAVVAVASLTDPAKLATLSGQRAVNPRLLKCVYWLNEARNRGRSAESVVFEAQAATHSTDARGALVRDSLLRNLDIAEKLGCLTDENIVKLRRGNSPVVTLGPYAGEKAEVDHIVPVSVAPELAKEFANLELLPQTLNRRQGAKIGARQRAYGLKFKDAGMISEERFTALRARP